MPWAGSTSPMPIPALRHAVSAASWCSRRRSPPACPRPASWGFLRTQPPAVPRSPIRRSFPWRCARPRRSSSCPATREWASLDSLYHRILIFDPYDQWPDLATADFAIGEVRGGPHQRHQRHQAIGREEPDSERRQPAAFHQHLFQSASRGLCEQRTLRGRYQQQPCGGAAACKTAPSGRRPASSARTASIPIPST